MAKRKRESPIPKILEELVRWVFEWVPARDLVISRRVSKGWKELVDSMKERFSTLSILYNGPSVCDPYSCPFESSRSLSSQVGGCVSNPPYKGAIRRVRVHSLPMRDFINPQDMQIVLQRIFEAVERIDVRFNITSRLHVIPLGNLFEYYAPKIGTAIIMMHGMDAKVLTDVATIIVDERLSPLADVRTYWADLLNHTTEADEMMEFLTRRARGFTITPIVNLPTEYARMRSFHTRVTNYVINMIDMVSASIHRVVLDEMHIEIMSDSDKVLKHACSMLEKCRMTSGGYVGLVFQSGCSVDAISRILKSLPRNIERLQISIVNPRDKIIDLGDAVFDKCISVEINPHEMIDLPTLSPLFIRRMAPNVRIVNYAHLTSHALVAFVKTDLIPTVFITEIDYEPPKIPGYRLVYYSGITYMYSKINQ